MKIVRVEELLEQYRKGDREFRGLTLKQAHLFDCNLQNINLQGSDLQESYLCYSNLGRANLSAIDLSAADLSSTLRGYFQWG